MHIFLFILYGVIGGVAILRIPFIRNSGIRPGLLLLLFAVHVAIGIVHNYIAYRYYPDHGDIWDYYWNSFIFRHRLVADFPAFLADNSSWTLFAHNGIIFIQVILGALSNDHLDINTLLFGFPVFLGNIALFYVFRDRFPKDPLTACSVFLTPSVLYWTSCIHREGMLFMLLGFLLLGLNRMMTGHFQAGRLIRSVICFLLIAYFRIGFALSLVVPVFIWLYWERRRLRPLLGKTAIAAIVAVFLLTLAFPGHNIPRFLASWQHEFTILHGHSRLPLPELDGTWSALFRIIPNAILNGLFEPLPGSGGQPIYTAFSIELLAIWSLAALALLRKPYTPRVIVTPSNTASPLIDHSAPFSTFCLTFAITGMLLVGIFVPFVGAIIRYRSVYLIFLLAPCLHSLATARPLRSLNDWLSQHIFYK